MTASLFPNLWRGWVRKDGGEWKQTEVTGDTWQEAFQRTLAVKVKGQHVERRAVPEGEHPKTWRGMS